MKRDYTETVSMRLPDPVLQLIARMRSCGFEAYAVGGAVRDSLLGRTPEDWDICTSAKPEETKACFPDFPVLETGLKHGTVTVLVDHLPYEITTYRIDGTYSDGRHPDAVIFSRDLREDLARRDFTVNAMAFSPEFPDDPERCTEGVLADPFGGRQDLQNRVIRTVGLPAERFSEDALRIFRAYRFAATLGFQIGEETERACRELANTVQKVSKERIQAELNKLVMGPSAGAILAKYRDAMEDALALPLADAETLQRMDEVTAGKAGRLAMLFGRRVRQSMKDLKYDTKTMKLSAGAEELMQNFAVPQGDTPERKAALCNLLRKYGVDVVSEAMGVLAKDPEKGMQAAACALDLSEILDRGDCWNLDQLEVKGGDLQALGINGPEIGAKLEKLLDAVVESRVPNEKEKLLEFLKTL